MQQAIAGTLEPVECWRLDGADRTAVFASFAQSVPALVWFGPTLPEAEDLRVLALSALPNVSAGQLDPLVPLTLCPTATSGWQGQPGVVAAETDGREYLPNPELESAECGVDGFAWSARDLRLAIGGQASIDPSTGLLTLSLTAEPGDGIVLRWISAGAVPVPASMPRILDHGGRWCGEFRRQETRFRAGRHMRESREGRTGHAHFPGVAFLSEACGENHGQALGATFAWSGGHAMIAEELPDGRRHLQFGLSDDPDGAGMAASHVMVGYSDTGLNGLSQAFTAHVASMHAKPAPRPLHYNCWEAVYFRHGVEELKEIADVAAGLGAERFVLDDGWFRGRNDDTTSLGDWTVDRSKYPDGLHPLTDHVKSLGMGFGIWFEPEMVNRDSDLHRAHPDWVLGPETQPSGRHQHVLDLSKPAVAHYLFERIDAVLSEYPVDYVKWDHNRILTGGTPDQTIALYRLFERLRKAHPDVDFESCASGGGRIDYGILAHARRVWLSDSNDALERLRMQHEAARWLPPEVVGSHVGPRVCHTSGRILSIGFRAWVAAQRHMGFEMDPRELTGDEAATLKRVAAWWKENRDFLFSARHYLLEANDAEVVAEMHAGHDAGRFIVFRGQAGASGAIAARPFALAGLDAEAIYEVRLVNPEDMAPLLNKNTATAFMRGDPIRLSGRALMQSGLPFPNMFPETMAVAEGRKI